MAKIDFNCLTQTTTVFQRKHISRDPADYFHEDFTEKRALFIDFPRPDFGTANYKYINKNLRMYFFWLNSTGPCFILFTIKDLI